MNAISIILLSIVAIAFATVAYNYFVRKKGRKSCCDSCAGCSMRDACNTCKH